MPAAVVLYRQVVESHHMINEDPVRLLLVPQGVSLPFLSLSVGQHLEQFVVILQDAVY